MNAIDRIIDGWFERQGWTPFEFQREAWRAFLDGESGLVHAPTGMGKTLSVWLGPVIERLGEMETRQSSRSTGGAEPIRILWITPLRALASDTVESLQAPVEAFGLPWRIEKRTGDTSSATKLRQRDRLPTALVTTPESLSILLSYPEARERFRSLRLIVVDEWHELLGTKRGVQTELGLARLRRWLPEVRTWGVSATLGNTEEAARVLLGAEAETRRWRLVRGLAPKRIEVETLIPADMERFPWSGHTGGRLVHDVVQRIETGGVTLLFTNTRAQAEIWFRNLLTARPEWIGEVAVHHGSLDRKIRERVEAMLREGRCGSRPLRCVVCTSSLDLGVDFSPVDQVIQVGSPKGVARLMQRAGRSGHQPGAISRVIGVPTHAFELVEFAAARRAIEAGQIESRSPLEKPLDTLVQHIVTIASGGGFEPEALYDEIRATHAFRDLTRREWQWALDFVHRGGPALTAYDEYARVVDHGGRWNVASKQVERLHRMSIGTITSDGALEVRYVNSGRSLGTIEESFLSRLRNGDCFVFAGRTLELVRISGMVAHVRRAKSKRNAVPRWNGGRMPLSTQLSEAVRAELDLARHSIYEGPEMAAARPLIELQRHDSVVPGPDELLFERLRTSVGHHLFIYPFAGRLVHEGLGALVAYRLSQFRAMSVTATMNDYGLELLADQSIEIDESVWRDIFRTDRLVEDLLAALNATELARRQFREIARIAGLVLQGFPGSRKPLKYLQASSSMFYDVFRQFDPSNLLLDQAEREVIEGQLEMRRLRATLERIADSRFVIARPRRLTPLSFPLFAERLRETHVTSERWEDRVRKMALELEAVVAAESAAEAGEKTIAPSPSPASPSSTARKGRGANGQTRQKKLGAILHA